MRFYWGFRRFFGLAVLTRVAAGWKIEDRRWKMVVNQSAVLAHGHYAVLLRQV